MPDPGEKKGRHLQSIPDVVKGVDANVLLEFLAPKPKPYTN